MTKPIPPSPDEDAPLLPSWFPGPLAMLAWAVLALALLKPVLPLSDQATGRHLTAGRVILEEGHIPKLDSLSYLYADREYLDFEWLFDMGSRLILNTLGLNTLVFGTFVVFTVILCVTLRNLLGNGVSLPVALLGTGLLAIADYVHLLTRPVILTYLCLTLVVFLWTRVLLRSAGKSSWWLPLIFLFWANIHPGFVSGLVFMGLSLLGAIWDERSWRSAHVKKASVLLVLSALATLINPYGWNLHLLIGHQVFHSKSLAQVQEFLPPDFSDPNGAVFALAVVLVSGFVLGLRREGKLWARDVLPMLFFLFFALRVQRHILLFLPVALLPLCRVWDEWLLSLFRNAWKERSDRYTALARQAKKEAGWVVAGILVIGTLFHFNSPPNLRIGTTFFTPQAEGFVRAHLELFQRPFTSTIQAGNLLFYFHPAFKVSFDDRVDFYQDADSFRHLSAIQTEGNWRNFLKEYKFDSALLYPTDPLVSGLRQEPGWTEIFSDHGIVIFKIDQK